MATVVATHLASHLAAMIGIAVAAVPESEKNAPTVAWADKWKHGYIGCKLRRAGAYYHEILTIAFSKEFLDVIAKTLIGKGTPSLQDCAATLWGYDRCVETVREKRGWWIFSWWVYVLKYKTCKEFCDAYNSNWLAFHNEEHGT
ncbi:MAG: hypothetical protein ACFFER_02620 [Candidatus Thorarchaeota archaeon]